MVIEFLTFTVAPADQAHWLDLDADTWTRFLQRQQRGFELLRTALQREDRFPGFTGFTGFRRHADIDQQHLQRDLLIGDL